MAKAADHRIETGGGADSSRTGQELVTFTAHQVGAQALGELAVGRPWKWDNASGWTGGAKTVSVLAIAVPADGVERTTSSSPDHRAHLHSYLLEHAVPVELMFATRADLTHPLRGLSEHASVRTRIAGQVMEWLALGPLGRPNHIGRTSFLYRPPEGQDMARLVFHIVQQAERRRLQECIAIKGTRAPVGSLEVSSVSGSVKYGLSRRTEAVTRGSVKVPLMEVAVPNDDVTKFLAEMPAEGYTDEEILHFLGGVVQPIAAWGGNNLPNLTAYVQHGDGAPRLNDAALASMVRHYLRMSIVDRVVHLKRHGYSVPVSYQGMKMTVQFQPPQKPEALLRQVADKLGIKRKKPSK